MKAKNDIAAVKKSFFDQLKPKRVIVKIGSALLADENSNLKKNFLRKIAREVIALESSGVRCVIVSSGALAAGKEKIGLTEKPRKLVLQQAAAAVGQPLLMYYYSRVFGKYGKNVAQILLTHADFEERARFLNARNTIESLMENGIIPVINENDTVATEEIKVGDNDTLAARVTDLVGADLLIMLSEFDGLFDRDPTRHENAKRISFVKRVSGHRGKNFLKRILQGEDLGTLFFPAKKKVKSRRYWLAYALTPRGTITVDLGAKDALVEKHKSLLPSGIIEVVGKFKKGDPIAISDPEGNIFAKGIAAIDSGTIKRIKKKKSHEIRMMLQKRIPEEVVHADNLTILPL
jgi:glutamate 5-kinase